LVDAVHQGEIKMKRFISFIIWLSLIVLVYGVVTAESTSVYLPLVFGPAPSPTPTLVPTLGPNDITVLPNYTTYVDIFNNLIISGEIINHTGSNFHYIDIMVDLQDANHQQLKTFNTSPYLDYLTSGEKTCFEKRDIQPAGWKYLSFEPVLKQIDTWEIPNLEASNLGLYYDANYKSYHVTGKVTNLGAKQIDWVRVVATAYNKDGKVIGCKYAGVSSGNIFPGSYGLFDVMFSGENYKDFNTFRVQASGSVH
jgi:hypothetical protein